MTRKWFSVREAADYWGIKSSTLYALLGRRKAKLPEGSLVRIGKQIRIDIEKIDANGGL
jgi:excisionase family DNA binding protein